MYQRETVNTCSHLIKQVQVTWPRQVLVLQRRNFTAGLLGGVVPPCLWPSIGMGLRLKTILAKLIVCMCVCVFVCVCVCMCACRSVCVCACAYVGWIWSDLVWRVDVSHSLKLSFWWEVFTYLLYGWHPPQLGGSTEAPPKSCPAQLLRSASRP